MARTALLAGATGLIGKQLLELLLNDSQYDKVIALSRSALPVNHHKLENVLMQAGEWDKLLALKAHDVFCCLGTTMKQAGSKEAFRKVDYEYPLELAKALKANGAQQFLLVSALGADKLSTVFYNKVKGETEEAITALGYDATFIFRPSLLLGDRKEQRPGEDAAKVVYKIFGWLIPKKYKGIDSVKVAQAMLTEARSGKTGKQVYESAALQGY
ncbi:MAG: NAD(P)H-binding protein [Cyclobacteriaceae bacterium]|nr:NAD(P)H-binding protein [Cyclobacteriaceae bacterium]